MAARLQECNICMDSFINPKLISCHHSFCCKCLEDYVLVNLRNGRFNCPICRTSVELPVGGVPALQSNFCIDTEAGDIFVCNICGPKKVACSRCVDCEENLCQSCSNVHEKLKVSRHHKICDLETLDSKTKGKIRQRIFCQEDPEEEIKLVCQDCKVVICMVCKVIKHENHGTEPVAVAATEMKKTIQAKLNECSDKLRHIDASKQKVKEFDRNINDAEQEELKAVDDQCLQLHKAIDQEGAKMKARIKHVYHDLRQQNSVLAGVIEDDFKKYSNTKDNVFTLSDQATDIDIIKKAMILNSSCMQPFQRPITRLVLVWRKKLFSPAIIKSSELTSLVGRIQDSNKLSPQAKFGSKYMVPLRFRRQNAQTLSSKFDSDGASGDDGQRRNKYVYIDMYRAYCKKNRLPLADFNTYRMKGSGFVSMITLYGKTYGNGDFFPTAKEAEDAAAKLAVQSLGLYKIYGAQERSLTSTGVSSLSPEEILTIKSRIKQIVRVKTNGLWATRLPYEYKEKFGVEAPAGLMDLVRNSFKDICMVEFVQHAEREVIYPVSADHDKCKDFKILQHELLPIGEKKTVYLTYIYNCGYFFVQKEDSCIDQITEELQKDCKTKSAPNMELLKIGQFCAGLFSVDKCWTRAKILDIKDSEPKMELLFVDYGDVDRVLSKDIRWLSEKTSAAPAQCIKCSLHWIQPLEKEVRWSSASAAGFADIGKDAPLIAVTKTHYDETCDVDLYLVSDPVISISDKLIQLGLVRSLFPLESYLEATEEVEEAEEEVEEEEMDASCPDPITLPDDKTWNVHITFINDSTNSVMMRFVGESYSDQLNQFENLLEQEFKKQKSEPVTDGMICVAHANKLYHRVHVTSIEDSKVTCFFVDHGDTNTLTMEQLRPLEAAINKKLPYQAVPVSLYGLEEVAENSTVLSKLCELALGKTCVAEPVNRDDFISVILYDTTGDSDININKEILKVVGKEGYVTAAIGDSSLMDMAAKLASETLVNEQKDSLSEETASKELGSEVLNTSSKQ